MMGTTHRQGELLRFITGYMAENEGASPCFEEMKKALGLNSKAGIHRMLSSLEERGLIRRLKNRQRSIEIITTVTPGSTYDKAKRVIQLVETSSDRENLVRDVAAILREP